MWTKAEQRGGVRGRESAYAVISKAVFLEDGPPKVLSDLIASLDRDL
jgi:hypothetical protein